MIGQIRALHSSIRRLLVWHSLPTALYAILLVLSAFSMFSLHLVHLNFLTILMFSNISYKYLKYITQNHYKFGYCAKLKFNIITELMSPWHQLISSQYYIIQIEPRWKLVNIDTYFDILSCILLYRVPSLF